MKLNDAMIRAAIKQLGESHNWKKGALPISKIVELLAKDLNYEMSDDEIHKRVTEHIEELLLFARQRDD